MAAEPITSVRVVDEKLGIEGFLVIDSLQHGLSAGGVRMRSGLTIHEVGRLARAMTTKFAAAGIPIGGAKSGINADPKRADKVQVMRRFGELIRPFLDHCYLAGEDMGTTRPDIAAMYAAAGVDLIGTARARMAPDGIAIGVPESFDLYADTGGPGLEELLTGHGVAACVEAAAELLGLDLAGARVSLQGFGNVGAGTAPHLLERGARIVALADIEGTLLCDDGLPIERLLRCRDDLGCIDRQRLPAGIQPADPGAWLEADCDILIPAAVADAVDAANADRVRARLVVEAANLPCTPDAEVALAARGVAVVPDFIANAGAACGFGMLLTGQVELDPPAIFGEVSRRLRAATWRVLEAWQQTGRLPRRAGEALADERLRGFARND